MLTHDRRLPPPCSAAGPAPVMRESDDSDFVAAFPGVECGAPGQFPVGFGTDEGIT